MTAARYTLMPAKPAMFAPPARFEMKAVAEDGTFEGYASLFNTEDLGHDEIAPGAFLESLRAKGAAGIKMLFQHNASEPIGVWEEIREDANGLYVRGRLTTAVVKAREVLSLMRAGALDGLSIGFKAQKSRRDAKSGVRRIEKADLWEISVVTFPMMPQARVASVKARPFAAALPTEREFERWLTRDAGLTRGEARALMHAGITGLKAFRNTAGRGGGDQMTAARIRSAAARLFQTA